MVHVGQKAPDFRAEAYHAGEMKQLSLSDFNGKWLVLIFYPLDFTFVCPTELIAFAREETEFKKHDVELVAISVDSVYSHKAWLETELRDVKFPVLSDIKKEIAREYGVLDEEKGVALRGTFVIDPEGVVQYSTISNLGLGRSTEETLRVIQALQTGELCPANWRPGAATLGAAS